MLSLRRSPHTASMVASRSSDQVYTLFGNWQSSPPGSLPAVLLSQIQVGGKQSTAPYLSLIGGACE